VTDPRALARAYLEQQQSLGTDAVVLPLTPGASPGMAPPELVPSPDARTPGAGPEDAPLPPPGISYDPPAVDLFANDPLQHAASLAAVAEIVAECRKCRLCESRTHTVPGEGPTDARLVVVGEGPGRTEDETGRPFVGKAGDLLTKILSAIELPREQVFICNVVKCRPPENRLPQYDEVAACVPYLFRQIEILKPKVILAMGGTAAQTLLHTKQSLGSLREHVHRFRGVPVVVTYHPAALLRNPNWKRPTWHDVRIARRILDA
jgi:DNA polymerase